MHLPAPVPSLLLLWLAAAAGAAAAQAPPPAAASGAGIYTCIDDRGRRLTSDRPIPECNAKEQRILNQDGSLKAIHPPSYTADERAAQAAEARRRAEARDAQADAVRRDRNLLARYPNEARHRQAREAALDSVRAAMRITDQRLLDLAAARKPLDDELEFYVGKPLPPKLRGQIDANDAAVAAQLAARQQQLIEIDRVNGLYDAELARLKLLWAGAAPGSLGPIAPAAGAAGATPVATNASAAAPSTLP